MTVNLQPCRFDDIDGWHEDDHAAAFKAFLVGAERMVGTPYKTRQLGVDGDALAGVAKIALSLNEQLGFSERQFFEDHFKPHQVLLDDKTEGFVTGFFEPVKKASRIQTAEYSVPLYRRPPDLIDIDDSNRPIEMDSYFRFGRIGAGGVEPYLDREAIQGGGLEGKGLELIWLADKTDAFFIHVQGSAKLDLGNDEFMRVTYAAKSGHHYTSVAKVLCKQTGTPPEHMTADKLADWMRSNPDKTDQLLANNQSYIFFEEAKGLLPDQGPVAAAKIPLVTGRSLAVDRMLHTFGSPIWVTTTQALPGEEKPLNRLMLAHDTGSAIVGAIRGDIFTGSGDDAGLKAGRIRHEATMTVLVPKP